MGLLDTALFLNQFGPLYLFCDFYFLIIRPQQKGDRRNMLSNLSEGDDVVTIGGIYGRILNIMKM